ncbi:MAG TPA: hypothetical protein VFW00_02355, partial [Rhodocyclaceae bacterium]|nr:hypothetical protein [Rhodocyclaceae bacterium]
GMDYIHIPVAFKAPKETDLMVFFDAMQVNAGRKMLVHCAANIRVAAFIGLYRIIKQGWSAHEALGLMRTVMEMQASRPKEHDVASEKIWSDFIDAMIGRLRNADSLRHGSHSKSSGQ